MTTRRQWLHAFAAAAVAAFPALAQQPRARRIGYLGGGSAASNAAWLAAFREGMAALRWVEERDYVIDARYANGVAQALGGLAAELAASQPELLLATGEATARPLAQRAKAVPIVFAIAQDPVGSGFAASLQRPGGNMTGLTSVGGDLGPKRLQLLKEAFPHISRVALLFSADNVSDAANIKIIEEAGKKLGVRITPIGLRQPADIEPAFKRGAAIDTQAYMEVGGFLFQSQSKAIVDATLRARKPAMFDNDAFVEAGGLMSYAPSQPDNFRRAAAYVDKILKGRKPGDLPIEQPTKFELVVNMKTAKAMGLTIPQSILLRAERVIE